MASDHCGRDIKLMAGKTALLVIDMQNYCARENIGCHTESDRKYPDEWSYFFERLKNVTVPAIQSLLSACRKKKGQAEVLYTVIECLTQDGRDQSLDYKLTGFHVAKGSEGAKVISELAPIDDEILIPKTSCSVFNSTNMAYVLRNLGVTQLVITGILTNKCVESAVRDAADLGFLVTVTEEGMAAYNNADQEQSLKNMRGFARISSVENVVNEITGWK